MTPEAVGAICQRRVSLVVTGWKGNWVGEALREEEFANPEDKTEAIVCDAAYRNKSAGFVLSIPSIQRYRCHLFRFRGLLSPHWEDCGNRERTGAVLCLKGLGWPPYRHSFIPGNGLNTRREEQSRPSVQGFCSLILLKIAGAPAPIAGWQRRTVEGCQKQRFAGPQYISQSSEIWDRYRAWLESWIRKWPCTSGGIFSANPRLSAAVHTFTLLPLPKRLRIRFLSWPMPQPRQPPIT